MVGYPSNDKHSLYFWVIHPISILFGQLTLPGHQSIGRSPQMSSGWPTHTPPYSRFRFLFWSLKIPYMRETEINFIFQILFVIILDHTPFSFSINYRFAEVLNLSNRFLKTLWDVICEIVFCFFNLTNESLGLKNEFILRFSIIMIITESKAAISPGVRPSKRFSMMISERKISEEPSSRAALAILFHKCNFLESRSYLLAVVDCIYQDNLVLVEPSFVLQTHPYEQDYHHLAPLAVLGSPG